MNNIKALLLFILLVNFLASCSLQVTTLDVTSNQPEPTQTPIPPTITSLPTETSLPTDTPLPTPPPCAVPLNPADNATIPASGPFDFTWTSFEGAVSYVIAIGPAGWYPTTFPVYGTSLTRYMETFPRASSYEWSIITLNDSGQEICRSGPYKFTTSQNTTATPTLTGGFITPSPVNLLDP